MDTKTAIVQRRAVKKYDPAFEIPEAEVQELLEHAILAPTSFNIQNWRIVRVTDPDQRAKLKEAAWSQDQVGDASEAFVICADLKSWSRDTARYWVNAPQPARDMLVPMIKQFYDGREQVQRDEAMRSAGLMAQTIMLMAKSMGYDSCPMIGFDAEKFAELISLPEDHVVCMMVVVGKATAPANPRGGQVPLDDVVVENRFS